MKLLSILFLLVLVTPAIMQVPSEESESSNKKLLSDSEIAIQADLELIDKIYCEPGMLTLALRLRYKNSNNKNLILYKYSNTPIGNIISEVEPNGKIKPVSNSSYTLSIVSTGFPSYKGKIDTVDPNFFVILAPGESYEISNLGYTIFPILKDGDFILERTFITLPLPSQDYRKIQMNWKDKGVVWIKNVTTMPMKFTIQTAGNKKSGKCEETSELPVTRCHVLTNGNKICENTN